MIEKKCVIKYQNFMNCESTYCRILLYYFFYIHPQLAVIINTEEEKHCLIARKISDWSIKRDMPVRNQNQQVSNLSVFCVSISFFSQHIDYSNSR